MLLTSTGPAEKAGVSVGSLVVAVGHTSTVTFPYEEVIRRIKASPKPLELTFRRLHATHDPAPHIGRLWQGFLRIFNKGHGGVGHWTGRFYLLRVDGSLEAFAGTDLGLSLDGCKSDGSFEEGGLTATKPIEFTHVQASSQQFLFFPDW